MKEWRKEGRENDRMRRMKKGRMIGISKGKYSYYFIFPNHGGRKDRKNRGREEGRKEEGKGGWEDGGM